MYSLIVLLLIGCVVLSSVYSASNEYSQKGGGVIPDDDNHFRIDKLNYIWSKVNKRLSNDILMQLQLALGELDLAYLYAKNEDSSLSAYVPVDKRLAKLLKKYKLDDILNAVEHKYNQQKVNSTPTTTSRPPDTISEHKPYNDQRLERLWQLAVKTIKSHQLEVTIIDGAELKICTFFETSCETLLSHLLAALREEFELLNAKMNSYHELVEQYNQLPHENSILTDNDDDIKRTDQTAALKTLFRQIEDGFESLSEQIGQSSSTADDTFVSERARNLFLQLSSNTAMSKDEFAVLRNVIHKLDRQLEKRKFYEDELKVLNDAIRKSTGGKLRGGDSIEHEEIDMRYRDFVRKSDKLDSYISAKIGSGGGNGDKTEL